MRDCSVMCPVRRRRVALTPEEGVRQDTISFLHQVLGCPFELMQVEAAITLNGLTKRCDIVVYDDSVRPWMIVECKKIGVPISQKVIDQACRYNIVLKVPYLMLTNGDHRLFLEVDYQGRLLRQVAAPRFPGREA